MDEQKTRDHIQAHADAVVRGDMDTALADFHEDMASAIPQLAEGLPQPVTAAEVMSVDMQADQCVAVIRYSGDDGELTVRSTWQDGSEHPEIVHAEPVT